MSHIQRYRGSFSSGKMKVLFKPDGPNPHTELALTAGFLLPELLKMEGFPRSSEMGSCDGALLFTRRKEASYGWDFKFSEKGDRPLEFVPGSLLNLRCYY
ncbi:hypothetical protein F2Q69_00021018 [Brassica cretica]|uniref:Uncharacterized protein n=1 Tax=Brassica cretica TaxID=69181 RepID=A0A8S9Q168_BRACR|nr:hypothetical protein F2Q69_00021018 [Brassica cretica]